jgi:MSHA biogenesis protein MshE
LRLELGGADHPLCKRGRGCSHCNGTGFLGRTGVYEMLEMTEPVVEAASQEDIRRFMHAARAQMAGRTLARHAAQIAAAGKTTVQEAMRVANQSED